MASHASPQIHVQYCHGLESGPHGYKVQSMRRWGFKVTAPDMHMSLYNPLARNSVARHLLRNLLNRPPSQWLAGAIDDALTACCQVQQRALAQATAPPDVLVGSSWGGAVAASLLALGAWSGPSIILCPALRLMERWMIPSGPLEHSALTAEAIAAQLARLPAHVKARCLLVHGTHDATVPLEDSRWLSSITGIRLTAIEGGSHGLSAIIKSEQLRTFIEDAASDHPLKQ